MEVLALTISVSGRVVPRSQGQTAQLQSSLPPLLQSEASPSPLLLLVLTDVLDVLTGDACATSLPPTAHLLFFFSFILFIFIFGCFGSLLLCAGFSLVAASRGYSSLQCVDFSWRWLLLLQSTGSRLTGFSSCGTRAQ